MSTTNGTTTTTLPRVSLLALNRKVVSEVEIEGDDGTGRWVGVRQFDGATYHAHQSAATTGGEGAIRAMYEIVGRLLPDATASEVERLTVESVGAVLSIASGQIAQVQALAAEHAEKNGSGRASPPSKKPRSLARATSSPKTT